LPGCFRVSLLLVKPTYKRHPTLSISATQKYCILDALTATPYVACMGRPPLTKEADTVKTTLRIPRGTLARIEELAGEGQVSSFIREAIARELRRRERSR